ncbi:MAG: lipid-A-disaccharide synthase [Chromatiales bacterium]|nr:lipid-A-disaccharide synthase [Chromatiales bacterium]
MLAAGEASGDLHAANLVRALDAMRPGLHYSGMGCGAMREAGVDVVVDATELAVVGLWEVLARYGDIRRAFRRLCEHMERNRPDLLILIDYVEFNLRLAKVAKRLGVRVLFYVSPQVWAWRPGRIRRIGRCVDMMAVLFPFEEDVYRRHGIPVRYVGNPLVDVVRPTMSREDARAHFNLDATRPILGLLPGSRQGELRRHLPVITKTCRLLREQIPDLQLIMPIAPGVDVARDVTPHLQDDDGIQLVTAQGYDVMHACDALIAASGTVTLEAGLIGTPMVIIYRLAPLSYAILKPMLRIPDIGLVNIVAGRRIAPEFLQGEARPEAIAAEVRRLLADADHNRTQREALREVRTKLGAGGGAENVARLASEMLDGAA